MISRIRRLSRELELNFNLSNTGVSCLIQFHLISRKLSFDQIYERNKTLHQVYSVYEFNVTLNTFRVGYLIYFFALYYIYFILRGVKLMKKLRLNVGSPSKDSLQKENFPFLSIQIIVIAYFFISGLDSNYS